MTNDHSLENIIERLLKLSLYVNEMSENGHVQEFPRLFSSYISEKIMDEVFNLSSFLTDNSLAQLEKDISEIKIKRKGG